MNYDEASGVSGTGLRNPMRNFEVKKKEILQRDLSFPTQTVYLGLSHFKNQALGLEKHAPSNLSYAIRCQSVRIRMASRGPVHMTGTVGPCE